MGFKDHFSAHAADYSKHRPHYPAELFAFLAALGPGRETAWDCATGNGQAAVDLARHFRRVIATDASAVQIANAVAHERVLYCVSAAESAAFGDAGVDLVTVAQALHWFELPLFYAEVRRVLRPRGILAVWAYNLLTVAPAIDAVVNRFYRETVGPCWPPERRLLEDDYRTVPFPFREQTVPTFVMTAAWTLDDLLGYVATWSATQRYRATRHVDPLVPLARELAPLWGDASASRTITWPVALRVGRSDR